MPSEWTPPNLALPSMGYKVKQILRRDAPRTETELLVAAKAAFQAISLTNCRGFFFSAKYATSFM